MVEAKTGIRTYPSSLAGCAESRFPPVQVRKGSLEVLGDPTYGEWLEDWSLRLPGENRRWWRGAGGVCPAWRVGESGSYKGARDNYLDHHQDHLDHPDHPELIGNSLAPGLLEAGIKRTGARSGRVLRCCDKGNSTVRWIRKATGLL